MPKSHISFEKTGYYLCGMKASEDEDKDFAYKTNMCMQCGFISDNMLVGGDNYQEFKDALQGLREKADATRI